MFCVGILCDSCQGVGQILILSISCSGFWVEGEKFPVSFWLYRCRQTESRLPLWLIRTRKRFTEPHISGGILILWALCSWLKWQSNRVFFFFSVCRHWWVTPSMGAVTSQNSGVNTRLQIFLRINIRSFRSFWRDLFPNPIVSESVTDWYMSTLFAC